MAILGCASCGYPIAAEPGDEVSCPMCSTANMAIAQGVTIPTPVLVGIIAFATGMFLGPALVASTSSGKAWLERQARR